jgi:DNA-binding NarL/FixJ family response regulator
MHTVFISYSSEDKDVAFGVCKALEAGGVTCWIASRDVMAGRPYSGQISEAIRRARSFVLVLSRKSDQSRQVLREVKRAAHSRLHLIAFRIALRRACGETGQSVALRRAGLREVQREGIAKAKSAGKYKGRKPIAPERQQHVLRLAAEGVTKTSIARQLGIGEATVYRILAVVR